MQVFVREHGTMIAVPVRCDVDGMPKMSHCARVPPITAVSKGSVKLTDPSRLEERGLQRSESCIPDSSSGLRRAIFQTVHFFERGGVGIGFAYHVHSQQLPTTIIAGTQTE
jgi:hypothetical protein